jgi:hypothetical protein
MNFLPEDYVEKRQAARAAIVFIGLLLVVVGGIVGAYLFTQWHMKGVFEERDRVFAAYEDAAKQIADAQELQRQKGIMAQKAEIISQLMERVRRSDLLGELTSTKMKPKTVNFVSLNLKTHDNPAAPGPSDIDKARRAAEGQLAVSKIPPADVTIELVGTAPNNLDVANYMASLKESPLLSGVQLIYSEEFRPTKDDKPVRKFSIEMHINPAADLRKTTVVEASSKD